MLKALQQWPFSGIPDNPGGWLFRVARNGALDALRRHASFRDKAGLLARELSSTLDDTAGEPAPGDDELRMMFMCCHPSLPRDARVALSLKTVGGFSVPEIARAFLTAEPAIAQRLVRAKRLIREMNLDLELPDADAFTGRLESVLEVIYLLFNEGYGARSGEDLVQARSLRRGASTRPSGGRLTRHGGPGGGCARRADGVSGRAASRAGRRPGRARSAGRSGPVALGRPIDRSWLPALRAERDGPREEPVPRPGRDRRRSCRHERRRTDAVGSHPGAVRRAPRNDRIAGRRPQPRRRAVKSERPCRGARSYRAARNGAGAGRVLICFRQ